MREVETKIDHKYNLNYVKTHTPKRMKVNIPKYLQFTAG